MLLRAFVFHLNALCDILVWLRLVLLIVVVSFVSFGCGLVAAAFIARYVLLVLAVVVNEIKHHLVIVELQEAKHLVLRQMLVALGLEKGDLVQLVV